MHVVRFKGDDVSEVLCKGQGEEGPFSKCGAGQTLCIRIPGGEEEAT